jgi:hypothetical protein
MNNRIAAFLEDTREIPRQPNDEPRAIGEILSELLAQYQRRFPDIRIAVVETPAEAV